MINLKPIAWQLSTDRPEFDRQPIRQFIRAEGSCYHDGIWWHRIWFDVAFTRRDAPHGYRPEDIERMEHDGDMDEGTLLVTHWAPANFQFTADDFAELAKREAGG